MVSCFEKICRPPSTYKDIALRRKLNTTYPVEKVRKPLHNISLIQSAEGMATVEATLVLPLFFIAMTLFLQLGFICVVQVQVYEAFSVAIQQVAERTFVYDKLDSEIISDVGIYEDVVLSLQSELKNISLIDSYVKGGKKGILVTKAVCDKEGYIKGDIRYYISVKLPFFNLSSVCVKEQIIQKAYVGLIASKEADMYVYVTDFQSVYHLSRNCGHLTLSIYELDTTKKCTLPPCSFCGSSGEALYATKDGDCYHTTLACQGLKRTVRRVKKSTVAGLPACEKCGG